VERPAVGGRALMREQPLVSIVIVNFRGADDTVACLEGIRQLRWDREHLEVLVVDNASGDGSAARIRAAAPDATVIESKVNEGFAGGCNRGARAARGRYVAFLNNDARPDPSWLDAAVPVLEADPAVACVASKVLDWDGTHLDFVDAALSFYGHGFKTHGEERDTGAFDNDADVLFASGAAMVVDAEVFASVGGFDERYFMFFEDVDFGWRLWLLGHRVRYVAASVVFHRHHASMEAVGGWREEYLLERNALFTMYKNYDDESLARFLPPALALAVRRGIALGGDDPHALEITRAPDDDAPTAVVSKHTLAPTYAIDGFVEALPQLQEDRARLQATRRRSDREILPLFRRPLLANGDAPLFLDGYRALVDAFAVDDGFTRRCRILVATGDTLQPAMAGPAIRAWQIASALAREHDVVLVSTTKCEGLHPADFDVLKVNDAQLRRLVRWCDVVVFQGYVMFEHPSIRTSDKVVVADIYDPFHLEQLEQARDLEPRSRRNVVRSSTDVLNEQLARGDLFLCASTKQRDFWLGQLAAIGRINPLTYDDDESLAHLVKIVPFGVSDTAPQATRPVLRGVVPGIGEHDKVVLWGGGIYNWFDPLSLLRAIDKLRGRLPEVRLYFLGMQHPNPHVPEMRMAVETRALADELGLTDVHVFFNDGWVEYDDRQNYLLEADVGVSTHLDHVETEFSFRTRILDYLWAGLPVVATGGDSLAELIDERGIGITVAPESVDELEAALYELLSDPVRNLECRRCSAALAAEFQWSKVLQPLVEFCRAPRRAPDLASPEMDDLIGVGRSKVTRPLRLLHLRDDLRTVGAHVKRGELGLMTRKAAGRVKQILTR
jgi:GT2 family glycosyltransferase